MTDTWQDPSGRIVLEGTATVGGSQPQTGAGSPDGAVTPNSIGGLYIDTTNGGLYIASGLTNADWVVVGGIAVTVGNVPGVSKAGNLVAVLGGADAATPLNSNGAVLSDAYSQWNGNGYGISWEGFGTDGDQVALIFVGGGLSIFNADGTFTSAKGVIFPTSDPHVAGAWWDNLGILTKSSG